MASGLPVIATDLPGNREALGNIPEQPYCRLNSHEDISQSLSTLIENSNLRKFLGNSNFLRSKEKFAIEAMCNSTTEIICNLLST